MTKLRPAFVSAFLFLIVPLSVFAADPGELHILPSGAVTVKMVNVLQIAGNNLFTRVNWGNYSVRLTVLLTPTTPITKKYGGAASIKDIKEGDFLTVEGTLADGNGNIQIKATKVTNQSVVSEEKTFSGSVSAFDRTGGVLTVSTKTAGQIKVLLGASVPIKKGARTIESSEVVVGDVVISVVGSYDFASKTLSASSMEVYQDKKLFTPRLFQGTIQSLSGTTLPATLTLSSGGTTYTVFLSEKTTLVSKAGSAISLSRIAVGDSVRLNGSIRETNFKEVTATYLRDLAF